MNSVNYTSKPSLQSLERHLNTMMDSQKCSVSKNVIEAGLMLPTIFDPVLFFIRLIARDRYGAAMRIVITKMPNLGLGVWKDTMRHMTQGRDTFDKRSAGGFSKEELVKLSNFVRQTGFTPFDVVG